MNRIGSMGGMPPVWKWGLVLAIAGAAVLVLFALSLKGTQTTSKPGSMHRSNSEHAKGSNPRAERKPELSFRRGPPSMPSETVPTPQVERPSPQAVIDSPLEETQRWMPEVYVEEEGETWMPEGVAETEAAYAGDWTPDSNEGWRPVVILPPGVTAEFEDLSEDSPMSFGNLAHRRVTRSSVRAGASGVRGRR